MAKQTVNNGESGLDVRNKINGNFTELYDGFGFDTPINWLPNEPGDNGTAARGFIDTAPANHPGEAWASLNVEVTAPGSEANLAANADFAGILSIHKQGFLSGTANSGEIDGLYIWLRQDGPDGLPQRDPDASDAAGVLANVQNVGSCGFVAQWEGVTTNIDRNTNTIAFGVRNYFGVLDMSLPTPSKVGYGVVAEAGVIDHAFLVQETGGTFASLINSNKVQITMEGDFITRNSFWPSVAWGIQRSSAENGSTQFTHRGTGALFFNAPEGQVRFDAAQGMLLPRMTTTQRNAIASPPDGLQIYNTTTAKMQVRAGGAWVDLH